MVNSFMMVVFLLPVLGTDGHKTPHRRFQKDKFSEALVGCLDTYVHQLVDVGDSKVVSILVVDH